MDRAGNFLGGFILGGLVGAVVTLLITPASGEELRNRVQEETQRIRDEVSHAAETRRAELEQQLAALRSPR